MGWIDRDICTMTICRALEGAIGISRECIRLSGNLAIKAAVATAIVVLAML